MNAPSTDQNLLRIVTATPPTTIDQVFSMMDDIDQTLPGSDGLKWFNRLYLDVTKQVRDHPGSGNFADPQWVANLDVVFANLYFKSVGDFLRAPDSAASSWNALFEARRRAG